jgi:RND family efflux transporter MFP subunit
MSGESRLTIHTGVAAAMAAALLLAGASGAYWFMRAATTHPGDTAITPTRDAAAAPSTRQRAADNAANDVPLRDVVVPLSTEAVERAGISTASVSIGTLANGLRLPGIVEPNAYRQVAVTPLVSGRITRVSVALGERVRRGQAMAEIYSPQLAEAQTRYVSARAMLDAHDRELKRTERLVEIGAASRQELERIHAEHAAQTAALQSARSQLELLGAPASALDAAAGGAVSATTHVPAPFDGVVTERVANVGLNVDPAIKLFTVVDLATVWVVADVYERDFSRVRIGTDASITTSAYPDLMLRGRIDYIDPQVSPQTRTAKVRVEVRNPRGDLRLGMYADVVITGAGGQPVPVIRRSAIQNIGARTVVYLADPKEPGKFIEREVRVGAESGEHIEVLSGLQSGDVIVENGSFFIRAERDRLGLRTSTEAAAGSSRPAAATLQAGNDAVQTARIEVSERGFEPATVTLRAGQAARITFVRTTDKTCGTEVVFPSLNLKKALPLNEPVTIEFTPDKAGDIAFACGMNMLKGVVVIQ